MSEETEDEFEFDPDKETFKFDPDFKEKFKDGAKKKSLKLKKMVAMLKGLFSSMPDVLLEEEEITHLMQAKLAQAEHIATMKARKEHTEEGTELSGRSMNMKMSVKGDTKIWCTVTYYFYDSDEEFNQALGEQMTSELSRVAKKGWFNPDTGDFHSE